MCNTLSKLFIFAAGAAIGSAVTWKLVETKYKRIAQEEIDSVKAAFGTSKPDDVEDAEEETVADQVDIQEYMDTVRDIGYTNYSTITEDVPEKQPETKPYVISPDEFAEMKDYQTVSLAYYADGVLTYENDKIVEDVDSIVGRDSLSHFGEYEDDSVFVRNDDLKTDYEILLDPRKFTDVVNKSPHRMEDEWDDLTR